MIFFYFHVSVLKNTSARLRESWNLWRSFLETHMDELTTLLTRTGRLPALQQTGELWSSHCQCSFFKSDDSVLLPGKNWNLHSWERSGLWNMLRRNISIQTQISKWCYFLAPRPNLNNDTRVISTSSWISYNRWGRRKTLIIRRKNQMRSQIKLMPCCTTWGWNNIKSRVYNNFLFCKGFGSYWRVTYHAVFCYMWSVNSVFAKFWKGILCWSGTLTQSHTQKLFHNYLAK